MRVSPKPVLIFVLLLCLSACQREAAGPVAAKQADAPPVTVAPAEPVAPTELKDIIETTDSYLIGISYAPVVNKYPGLAQAVGAYAHAARAELMEAVAGLGNDKPSAPYELSLNFEQVLDSPELVAVSADGSRYTGGAHGQPLVHRFVWLPAQQRMLTAEALVPKPENWGPIAAYVREQLLTSVSVRADADELTPQERLQFVRNADKMVAGGTEPDVANFSQFLPVV
ncbi:MAG: DUF4163 domain-containing protein, partial [Pseudoxanthomonas sp.]|nr:DUF4163 domain-containing protein [Pseudoxanthomonas sp.]